MIINEVSGKEFLSKAASAKAKAKALKSQKYWVSKLPELKEVRLDKDLLNDLASLADQEGISVSFLVCAALLQCARTLNRPVKTRKESLSAALQKSVLMMTSQEKDYQYQNIGKDGPITKTG
jgi:antitoxin component of RelBE/YafQ-DinJ toxin-antitoxin module